MPIRNAHAKASPTEDGLVSSDLPLELPFMAPRIQGDFRPDGKLDLSIWGCGRLSSVSFSPLSGPFTYAPNRLTFDGGGFYTAQSVPAVLLRGIKVKSVRAASRCAWWGSKTKNTSVSRKGKRKTVTTPWGVTILETRGDDLVISAGASLEEAEKALSIATDDIIDEADRYVKRCDVLDQATPVMRSMMIQSMHASLSSVRRSEDGGFLGLAAGQAYSAPTRTYYRDGYWTLQTLLHVDPSVVLDQIDLLAQGVQADGEAPSGVILTGPAQSLEWEKFRTTDKAYEEHLRPGDWWSDHFDSPLFFILTIGDYIRTTDDTAPLKKHWTTVLSIFERYKRLDQEGCGLPMKPRHDRDWADNVYRHGYVSYDIGLWIGALDVLRDFGKVCDERIAAEADALVKKARGAVDETLLTDTGWYADYGVKGEFVEDHLALDSLTLLRFDAVSEERSKIVLEAVRQHLETRNNATQPYGDWGVMCAFPPFKRHKDTRAKSAFTYRYHNGSDWPYLSGLYAEQRLRHGLDGWEYPLTRWWEISLEEGWIGSVEYYSPPFGRGSLLQGWTGMNAAAVLQFKDRVMRDHKAK